MTTGIIPSSMQGKGGKRLNRNDSSIKSNSLIKINCFPTKKPKTKSASPNIPCSSQFGLGLPIWARPSRSVGEGAASSKDGNPWVAPSKSNFGVTTPYRSAPSGTLARDGINRWGDPRKNRGRRRKCNFSLIFIRLCRRPRLRAVTPVCRQAGTSACRHGLWPWMNA